MISPKIIWTEGMFLRPQHFQYFEQHLLSQTQMNQQMASLPYWGFSVLELDQAALALGFVQLVQAQGVLPDGVVFSCGGDELPTPLRVRAPIAAQRVYLARPRLRTDHCELVFDESAHSQAPYRVVEKELLDRSDPQNELALVQQGQVRWSLLLESQMDADWVGLPFLRLKDVNGSTDEVRLDTEYMTPVLHYQVCPVLRGVLHEVYGMLQARSELLANRLQQLGRFMTGDMAELMALQSLNAYRNRCWGMLQLKRLHPQECYLFLLELLGSMSTFSEARRLATVRPEYVHDDLQRSFAPLLEGLRLALNTLLEQLAVRIELQDKGQGVYVGQINDQRLLQHAKWILAVKAEVPEAQLRQYFPAQVKVAGVDKIRDLVHLQLPGVAVNSMSHVPRELPLHSGYVYFSLAQQGEMWQQLQKTSALAVHLAGDFPGLEIECWAVKQSSEQVGV